jgi:hypothetical protein
MNATERAWVIKRALLRALDECGKYAVPESALVESALIKIDHLSPTTAEIDAQLRVIGTERLSVSLPSERGTKWQINDAGRLWLAANP